MAGKKSESNVTLKAEKTYNVFTKTGEIVSVQASTAEEAAKKVVAAKEVENE